MGTLQIKYLAPQPNMLLSFQEMYPDLCSHDSLTTLILLQLNEKAYLWIIQNSDNFRPHSSYMIVKKSPRNDDEDTANYLLLKCFSKANIYMIRKRPQSRSIFCMTISYSRAFYTAPSKKMKQVTKKNVIYRTRIQITQR